MSDDRHADTTHRPDWWDTNLHVAMMLVSVIMIGVGAVQYPLNWVDLPDYVGYGWLPVLVYVGYGVYLDARTLRREHNV